MRVVVVVPGMMEGGGIRVVLGRAAAWEEASHPTCLFAAQSVSAVRCAPSGDVRVVFGDQAHRRFRRALPRILRRLVGECRDADVVVSGYEAGRGLLIAWVAARLTRRPLVALVQASPHQSVASWTPPWLRKVTLRVLGRAQAAICVSPDLVGEVVDLGVAPGAVRYIPNGRDVEGIRQRAEQVRATAAAPVTPLVVAIGRLTPQKGFDVLMEAHARVVRGGRRHDLRIYGEGPQKAALEGLARDLGVADSVTLMGFAQDVAEVLALASVFCLSSRHEGQPLVLIEAMAAQVPVIATRCSTGVVDLLGDGLYGDLVPAESSGDLADALDRHLSDPSRLRGLLGGGSTHIASFAADRPADAYIDFFREQIGGGLAPEAAEAARP